MTPPEEKEDTVGSVTMINDAMLRAFVTTRVFGEKNLTPYTLVIVPGSVAITYKTHCRIISFPYNENRVQSKIYYIRNNSVNDFSTSPLG
jgi:hypothetical protein